MTRQRVLDGIRTVVSDSTTGLASVIEQNAASMQETSASLQILSESIESSQKDTVKLVELSKNRRRKQRNLNFLRKSWKKFKKDLTKYGIQFYNSKVVCSSKYIDIARNKGFILR